MNPKKLAWGLAITLVALLLVMRIVLSFVKTTPTAETADSSPTTPTADTTTPAQSLPAPPATDAQQVEPPAAEPTPTPPDPAEEEAARVRVVYAASLGQLAKSILAYNSTHGDQAYLTDAQSGEAAHSVALLLAAKADLNDASLYFVPGDPLGPKTIPQTVLTADSTDGSVNPEFASANLSIVIAASIPPNSPPATTPILWTRGLQSDGTWAPDSPFHGQGGYVVFMDGHIEWFSAKPEAAAAP